MCVSVFVDCHAGQVVVELCSVNDSDTGVEASHLSQLRPIVMTMIVIPFVIMVVVAQLKEGGNLGRFRHPGGLDQHVVEHLFLGQGDDLLHQVALQRAAEASVLHRNHLSKKQTFSKNHFVKHLLLAELDKASEKQ